MVYLGVRINSLNSMEWWANFEGIKLNTGICVIECYICAWWLQALNATYKVRNMNSEVSPWRRSLQHFFTRVFQSWKVMSFHGLVWPNNITTLVNLFVFQNGLGFQVGPFLHHWGPLAYEEVGFLGPEGLPPTTPFQKEEDSHHGHFQIPEFLMFQQKIPLLSA